MNYMIKSFIMESHNSDILVVNKLINVPIFTLYAIATYLSSLCIETRGSG